VTPCRLVRVDPPCRGRGAGYRSVAAGSISHLSKSSTSPPLSSFRAGVFPRFLPPIFHEGPVRLGSISVGAGVGKRRRGRSTSGCIRGVVRVSVRLSFGRSVLALESFASFWRLEVSPLFSACSHNFASQRVDSSCLLHGRGSRHTIPKHFVVT
jgi:hypothetical protein